MSTHRHRYALTGWPARLPAWRCETCDARASRLRALWLDVMWFAGALMGGEL